MSKSLKANLMHDEIQFDFSKVSKQLNYKRFELFYMSRIKLQLHYEIYKIGYFRISF